MIAVMMLIQAATQPPLNLTCAGAGTANKVTVNSIYGNSSTNGTIGTVPYSGTQSGSANVYGQRQQDFADQVDVRLFSGDDRIRMPRTMLPAIRGGEGGWFKLKNIVATERAITGSVAVNFINNPKIHIDRVTGTISISGKAGDYAGQCAVIDPTAKPRF